MLNILRLPPQTVKTVNTAIDKGSRICAVGTTTMRSIESAVSATNALKEVEGWTNLFIYPPYAFNIANAMITNFHLPNIKSGYYDFCLCR